MEDKEAIIFKVQNLYGTHGRISDGDKCGGGCALPGEISGIAIDLAPTRDCDDDVAEVSRDHSGWGRLGEGLNRLEPASRGR